MNNPFEIFEIEMKMNLSLKELDSIYINKQSILYLKLINDNNKDLIYNEISETNTAYEILKDPIRRANSILNLLNISILNFVLKEDELVEVMNFYNELDLINLASDLEKLKGKYESLYNQEFNNFCTSLNTRNYELTKESFIKMSYLDKILTQINEKLIKSLT